MNLWLDLLQLLATQETQRNTTPFKNKGCIHLQTLKAFKTVSSTAFANKLNTLDEMEQFCEYKIQDPIQEERKQKSLYQLKNLNLQLNPFTQRNHKKGQRKRWSLSHSIPSIFLTSTPGKYIEKRKISGQ